MFPQNIQHSHFYNNLYLCSSRNYFCQSSLKHWNKKSKNFHYMMFCPCNKSHSTHNLFRCIYLAKNKHDKRNHCHTCIQFHYNNNHNRYSDKNSKHNIRQKNKLHLFLQGTSGCCNVLNHSMSMLKNSKHNMC